MFPHRLIGQHPNDSDILIGVGRFRILGGGGGGAKV